MDLFLDIICHYAEQKNRQRLLATFAYSNPLRGNLAIKFTPIAVQSRSQLSWIAEELTLLSYILHA